jgi:hypothetical protein
MTDGYREPPPKKLRRRCSSLLEGKAWRCPTNFIHGRGSVVCQALEFDHPSPTDGAARWHSMAVHGERPKIPLTLSLCRAVLGSSADYDWGSLWKTKTEQKCKLFGWPILQNKLWTADRIFLMVKGDCTAISLRRKEQLFTVPSYKFEVRSFLCSILYAHSLNLCLQCCSLGPTLGCATLVSIGQPRCKWFLAIGDPTLPCCRRSGGIVPSTSSRWCKWAFVSDRWPLVFSVESSCSTTTWSVYSCSPAVVPRQSPTTTRVRATPTSRMSMWLSCVERTGPWCCITCKRSSSVRHTYHPVGCP